MRLTYTPEELDKYIYPGNADTSAVIEKQMPNVHRFITEFICENEPRVIDVCSKPMFDMLYLILCVNGYTADSPDGSFDVLDYDDLCVKIRSEKPDDANPIPSDWDVVTEAYFINIVISTGDYSLAGSACMLIDGTLNFLYHMLSKLNTEEVADES